MSDLRVALPEPLGEDPVSASALAHQPEALAAFQRLYGVLWSHGEVDLYTKELARLRNARLVGCTICQAIRFEGPRREGLSEEVIAQLRDPERSSLGPRERAVVRLVDTMLGDPRALDDAQREELLAHFTPAQLVELSAGIALFMGFSKLAVALGGLPESLPPFEQPTPGAGPENRNFGV